jgi:hypothetical protein
MNKIVHYVGLDVHKDSIAVSIAPPNSTEVRRYGGIGGTLDAVGNLRPPIFCLSWAELPMEDRAVEAFVSLCNEACEPPKPQSENYEDSYPPNRDFVRTSRFGSNCKGSFDR